MPNKRILLIDDDDGVRKTVRMMLQRHGFDVDEASDGLSGINKFRAGNYDLVITDVFMPEKDGLELVRELKRLSPPPKIIVISGNPDQPQLYLKAAALLQAEATLQKPFSMQTLIERVQSVIGT